MIADLKPYPAMKDSGMPWLGAVPWHWEIELGKWLFRKMNRPIWDASEVVTCFRDGIVTLRKNRRVRGFTESLKEIGYQGIRRGDLVIHGMDAFAGAIGVADSDGKGTPVYSVCEPGPTANAQYYAFALREMARSQWIQALAKGIRERSTDFRFEGFGSQPVPLPPLCEQAAIVRFLDYADRRIRRYIRAKQKLITLLEEQKQVLIYGAVTRGLDPNVRLKPSGVEWLGDVPEHWGIRRSKRTFTPRKELARPNDIQLSATQAYGVIAQEDYEERVRRKIVKISRHLEKRRHVEVDDFVISMRSFQGGLERAWVSGCIRSSYIVLQPAARLNVGYFGYLFKSVGYITALQSTANFIRDGQDLNFENFCGVDLPYLPIEEQRRIAQFLDDATADITTTIERSRREIDLFGEYRTRLIADVVTGKLDVRAAADGLPEVDSLADDDALTTQAAETGVMELEDATESPEEFAMENEATV